MNMKNIPAEEPGTKFSECMLLPVISIGKNTLCSMSGSVEILISLSHMINDVRIENGNSIINIDIKWPIPNAIVALNRADFFRSKSAADTARGQPIAGLKP